MHVLYIPISSNRFVLKKAGGGEDKTPVFKHYKTEASEGKISTNFVPGRWKRLLDRFRFQPEFCLGKETSVLLQTITCTCSMIIKADAKRKITKETARGKLPYL